MRDRLIELIKEAKKHTREAKSDQERNMIFAEHLLGNGVIVLPCKVGDTLYVISQMKDKRILPFINEYKATSIEIKKKGVSIFHAMDGYIKIFRQTDFGKTVFFSEEEAKRAITDIIVGGK